MKRISNTQHMVRVLRIAFTRKKLAQLVGATVPTIIRWEDGDSDAQVRFEAGFRRAVDKLAHRFRHYPDVADAIKGSIRPRLTRA